MPDSDVIDDLMLRWESARLQGEDRRPEEICAEHPQHLSEVRRRVAAVEAMERVLGVSRNGADSITSPSAASDPPGESLPRIPGYEMLRLIDQGGMGVVYEARQTALGRRVAIKMVGGIRPEPTQLARFRMEAEASARLQHPNFVQIFEVGQANGRPFFSMEFIDGGSLAQRLLTHRPAPRQGAELVHTLAHAIHAAHESGILHRDLKPSNIMLTASGVPKIADFGLAKRLGDDSGHTRTGEVLGTPSYMAPEQASGQKELIGPATDVYALGAILYELLAGRPPFRGESALDSLRMVTTQDPIPPSRLVSSTPPELEAICLKCLEKSPQQRYASARDLAEDLDRFLHGRPVTARRITPLGRAWKLIRRHPQAVALSIALSVLAAIGVIYAIARYRAGDPEVEKVEPRAGPTEAEKEAARLRDLARKAELEAPRAREILERNCFACHGQAPAKSKKNLNILDHKQLLNPDRKIVVPGDPAHSRLIQRIEDGSMPPEEEEVHLPRVTEQEVVILRDWVLGGAPALPMPDLRKPTPPVVPYSELAAKVQTIFHQNCYRCHKFDKKEGGIKILDYRLLVTVRRVVIPGKPEESELFKLVSSRNDEMRMPPADEAPPLPRHEIDTIKQWILEGAPPFPRRK